MYDTRIDLSRGLRADAISLLQTQLVAAAGLFTQVKQAHWNVKGPNFIALHELFDSVAEIVEDHGDSLAERITALGGRADGTVRVAAGNSAPAEYPLAAEGGRAHAAAVADRLAAFGATTREHRSRRCAG